MKDAAELVGVDYRTIELGIESGTIPTVQLDPRRMIRRAGPRRAFGVDA
ncbi:DNA-binding protein [Microbacterium elymi]|uniref:DNA-binding protein n=1 Tax=Microbacterium elymi TaxID=2909587 RepID=A0ABY5NMH4_9MICO|nr:DNA-binding protein [Microbacterium elymi]UUT36387.1 DNA-binding protein [Microbacterium elymi]